MELISLNILSYRYSSKKVQSELKLFYRVTWGKAGRFLRFFLNISPNISLFPISIIFLIHYIFCLYNAIKIDFETQILMGEIDLSKKYFDPCPLSPTVGESGHILFIEFFRHENLTHSNSVCFNNKIQEMSFPTLPLLNSYVSYKWN